jgi:hypothetical protein
MRYQDRKLYDAEIDYCRRAVQLAEWRLKKERREHAERLQDRAFVIILIIASGIAFALGVYSLASFAHWAQFGC